MSSLAEQWADGHSAHRADSRNRIENAYKCLRILKESFPFDRVADFGCGIGGWLAAARDLGASEIRGFEGPWIAQADTVIPKENIELVSLDKDLLNLSKYYDLAMSIEVAEHLPPEAADRFVATLVSAADKILFSAAIPGQGGLGHLNEQPLGYWVGKFWAHHYVPLEILRPYIAHDRQIYPWLRQNLIMFITYGVLVRSPALYRFTRPLSDFNLRYPCAS
jgi:hypothetical protein